MICHRLNGDTGQMKKLFEAEYEGLKKGHPVFKGEGGYVGDRAGPYDYKYRLKFTDASELRHLIDDLVQAYNDLNEEKDKLHLADSRDWDAIRG